MRVLRKGGLALILAMFCLFGTASGSAEEKAKTAFDIIPGIVSYPGINAQAELGFEFAAFKDFSKGWSTELLNFEEIVGLRYGNDTGFLKDWSAHTIGVGVGFDKLAEVGLNVKLPPFMKDAGIQLSTGWTKDGIQTGSIKIWFLKGAI